MIVLCGYAQQVSPRIAGLAGHQEYMSLLREDSRLQMKEDSIVKAVGVVRRQFRDNPQNKQSAKAILALEEQIFGVRNEKARLIDRIGTIEREWVMLNLNSPKGAQSELNPSVSIPEQGKVRNLIYNPYFREQLPMADYTALEEAQRQELVAVDYINRYMANYQEVSSLAQRYAEVQTEIEAAELFEKHQALQNLNKVLSDSLATVWNFIFDNKGYAYSYLLDKLGQDEMLAREERLLAEAARQVSEVKGEYASDALADYFLRKRVMTDSEIQMGALLQLDAARDSLRGVAAQLKEFDFSLPKVDVAIRYFIDYAPVAFASVPKYTTQNPIPECRVYPQGAVYRVLLGTFSAKRPVSVFRGAYPLCYQVDDEGKWRYFAGGFVSREEADEAQKQLKSRGFVKPEVVVWRNGVYRNLSRNPERTTIMYKVEIQSAAALSDAVKTAISAAASEHELSRVGQNFVIGLFSERAQADLLADTIRKADGALKIKVVEISEISK